MMATVIETTVQNTLCCGCGVCAAICPKQLLTMEWNPHGEYNPMRTEFCSNKCGLCLRICPFSDSIENEDTIGQELYGRLPGIQHRSETGYYLATYVGYSEAHRQGSASGGVATWLLERLLAEGIVDYVVCVAPTNNPEKLYTFTIFNTVEGVRNGAGSAYYPVEMSRVIKYIIETPGRYAITGLPCFIKAIRLAQQSNTKLRERIVVTIGLVCGQLKSRHFTDYIAAFAGVRGKVTGVRYRGKSPNHPTSNYHYAFKTEKGEEHRIFWSEGIAEAWTNRWFTPNACNYCDDIFAECADVTCMDAWLPEYSKDHQGTSLVLVRSPLVEEVVARGQGVRLDAIPIERVMQSNAGVVSVKRRHLSHRLYLDREKGPRVLKKRVEPVRLRDPFLRQEVILKERMRVMSRDIWATDTPYIKSLQEAMRPVLRQLAVERQIAEIILSPIRTLRHTWGKFRSSHNE